MSHLPNFFDANPNPPEEVKQGEFGFACSECGHELRGMYGQVGTIVHCEKCAAPVSIPMPKIKIGPSEHGRANSTRTAARRPKTAVDKSAESDDVHGHHSEDAKRTATQDSNNASSQAFLYIVIPLLGVALGLGGLLLWRYETATDTRLEQYISTALRMSAKKRQSAGNALESVERDLRPSLVWGRKQSPPMSLADQNLYEDAINKAIDEAAQQNREVVDTYMELCGEWQKAPHRFEIATSHVKASAKYAYDQRLVESVDELESTLHDMSQQPPAERLNTVLKHLHFSQTQPTTLTLHKENK